MQDKISRAESARRNGALSRGPKTDEGKARSARNGFKHGLTAQVFLSTPAEEDAFRHHLDALVDLWDPQSAYEHYLVEKLARADFQHDRAERMIFAMVDLETDFIAPEIQRTYQTIDETGCLILGYKSMDDHSASHRNLDRHLARLSRERIRARDAIIHAQTLRTKKENLFLHAEPNASENANDEPESLCPAA